MGTFIDFISLSDPTSRYVIIGIILLTINASLVGSFAFLRKKSLIGDAVAHSVLPGICLAFLLFQTKNLFILLGGAAITGWLSILSIDLITAHSRIKADAAIGIALSVFFALGIVLLTIIQNSAIASQSGLDHFLFGKAASITRDDVRYFAIVTLIITAVIIIFYKPFKLISFNQDFAVSIGLPVRFYEFILSIITVMSIAVGIQAVGVVLMAALLITPAAAARYWTNDLRIMLILAVVVSAIGGVGGAYISYSATNMPTGPWIIVIISCIAFLSFAFAPNRGIVSKMWIQYQNRKQILLENILKAFYHVGEKDNSFLEMRKPEDILNRREFSFSKLSEGLNKLKRKGLLEKQNNEWKLSSEGLSEAKRIIRLHRLWELYLTQYLNIAEDHVHDDAEAIEHVLTPEIEAQLEKLLDFPSTDPHGKEIIY
ncbi:MAG: iron chelate uptake ABC transporter family permease subunit [Chitinophagales bacterium]|nr:iron chelate uptake ABC transporter family permease subunit [Chitinophagales bacterium]